MIGANECALAGRTLTLAVGRLHTADGKLVIYIRMKSPRTPTSARFTKVLNSSTVASPP